MKSYIFTAVALLSAVTNGAVLKRQSGQSSDKWPGTLCKGATTATSRLINNGDKLAKIAEDAHVGICDIAAATLLANPNVIVAGEYLWIPDKCDNNDNASCLEPDVPATDECVLGLPNTYDVRKGDTLTAIAKDFNITLAALEGANKQITNPDLIQIAQEIFIPVCDYSVCSVGPYKIVANDIYLKLAQVHHSTVGQIKALNRGVDETKLAIGQQIILPSKCQQLLGAERR